MAERKTYTPEDLRNYENAYVQSGMTLEEISTEYNVPLPNLKRWSSRYNWKKKQDDYKKQNAEFNTRLAAARDDMMAKFEKDKDINALHAALKVQGILESRPDPREIMKDFAERLIAFCKNRSEDELAREIMAILPEFSRETVG